MESGPSSTLSPSEEPRKLQRTNSLRRVPQHISSDAAAAPQREEEEAARKKDLCREERSSFNKNLVSYAISKMSEATVQSPVDDEWLRPLTDVEKTQLGVEVTEETDKLTVLKWKTGESTIASPIIHHVWVGGVLSDQAVSVMSLNFRRLALNIDENRATAFKGGFAVVVWLSKEFNRPVPHTIRTPAEETQLQIFKDSVRRVQDAVKKANTEIGAHNKIEFIPDFDESRLNTVKESDKLIVMIGVVDGEAADSGAVSLASGDGDSVSASSKGSLLNAQESEMCRTFFNEIRADTGLYALPAEAEEIIQSAKYLARTSKEEKGKIIQPTKYNMCKGILSLSYDDGSVVSQTIQKWQKRIELMKTKYLDQVKQDPQFSKEDAFINVPKVDPVNEKSDGCDLNFHLIDYVNWVKTYGLYAGLSDVIRLRVLFNYGGMYMDIDDVLINARFQNLFYGEISGDAHNPHAFRKCNLLPEEDQKIIEQFGGVGKGLQECHQGVRITRYTGEEDKKNNDVIIAPKGSTMIKKMLEIMYEDFSTGSKDCFGHSTHLEVLHKVHGMKLSQAQCIMYTTEEGKWEDASGSIVASRFDLLKQLEDMGHEENKCFIERIRETFPDFENEFKKKLPPIHPDFFLQKTMLRQLSKWFSYKTLCPYDEFKKGQIKSEDYPPKRGSHWQEESKQFVASLFPERIVLLSQGRSSRLQSLIKEKDFVSVQKIMDMDDYAHTAHTDERFGLWSAQGDMRWRACSMNPLKPTFRPTSTGKNLIVKNEGKLLVSLAPRMASEDPNQRYYEWDKKVSFALSIGEIGTLLATFRDGGINGDRVTFTRQLQEGTKSLVVTRQAETGTLGSVNLKMSIRDMEIARAKMDMGEWEATDQLMRYLLPRLCGFDQILQSLNIEDDFEQEARSDFY
eukprot:g4114.t1